MRGVGHKSDRLWLCFASGLGDGRGGMRSRGLMIVMMVVGFALMTCLQGCETAKGLTKGLQSDAQNAYHHLSKIDDWMKENMW